jgi:CRP/FNR family transcriptional regulator, cyclic AMP receptor protein
MQSTVLGRWLKDGQVICRQGELGDCLYIIEKGQVELMRRDGSTEFCLRVLEAGDIWGEGGLLERDHVRTATARAIGEVCVLTIEKRMFLDRIHEDPSFALKIMRRMSRRIRELEDALVRTAAPLATELQAVPHGPTVADRKD